MSIREEGLPFALPVALIGGIFFLAGNLPVAALALGLFIFIAAFFRDPERHFPEDKELIASPADGRIIKIERKDDRLSISVFMSVFNVHVNRAPTEARITGINYYPGKFMAAWSDKASLDNEQVHIFFDTDRGPAEVVLIAGLVARRIICWAREKMNFQRGERIGMIRFGSRVDLHLPASETEALVSIGDRVKAGATPIAKWKTSDDR